MKNNPASWFHIKTISEADHFLKDGMRFHWVLEDGDIDLRERYVFRPDNCQLENVLIMDDSGGGDFLSIFKSESALIQVKNDL